MRAIQMTGAQAKKVAILTGMTPDDRKVWVMTYDDYLRVEVDLPDGENIAAWKIWEDGRLENIFGKSW